MTPSHDNHARNGGLLRFSTDFNGGIEKLSSSGAKTTATFSTKAGVSALKVDKLYYCETGGSAEAKLSPTHSSNSIV